jgi:pimeloyl-ACP methyl ester carboxylesterase
MAGPRDDLPELPLQAAIQNWDEAPLREYIEHGFRDLEDGSVELKCPPDYEARMYLRGAHTLPAGEMMPNIRIPVLLLRGQASPVFGEAVAQKTLSLLPDAKLVAIPGGHFAPFEHTALMQREVEAFLGYLRLPEAELKTEEAAG